MTAADANDDDEPDAMVAAAVRMACDEQRMTALAKTVAARLVEATADDVMELLRSPLTTASARTPNVMLPKTHADAVRDPARPPMIAALAARDPDAGLLMTADAASVPVIVCTSTTSTAFADSDDAAGRISMDAAVSEPD